MFAVTLGPATVGNVEPGSVVTGATAFAVELEIKLLGLIVIFRLGRPVGSNNSSAISWAPEGTY